MAAASRAALATFLVMLFTPWARAFVLKRNELEGTAAVEEPDDIDALKRMIAKLKAQVDAKDHGNMVRATTYDEYACEAGSSRVFDLRNSDATTENCNAACMADTSCVLYGGIFGAWCIGCDSFQAFTVQNGNTAGAVAYVKTTPSPTSAPTSSPTPVPTPNPTPAPTPPSISISAVGDPHLTNVHGEKFDLMQEGKHLLVKIPKNRREAALLRVDAVAERFGGQCADIYFQELNITGKWVDKKKPGGFRYHAQGPGAKRAHWVKFGPLQLKVAHGHTHKGVKYLNFYVKNLGHTGYVIGGLLGEDDHSKAEATPKSCLHLMAL